MTKCKLTESVLKLQSDISDTYAIWDGLDTDTGIYQYRYVLYREWDVTLPAMAIIGLNPSSADEQHDDRTVRRCIDFAKREGCGALAMLNIFAYRATNPAELASCPDPVGRDNDHYIRSECENAMWIIVAWGTHGKLLGRGAQVVKLLRGRKLLCFGINQDGSPKHPLYLSNNAKIIEFNVET
jgi:hypothetical protein